MVACINLITLFERNNMKKELTVKTFSVFGLLFFYLTGCGNQSTDGLLTGSRLGDIYLEDEKDPSRRHKATDEERLWTVSLGGCSASLLSSDYLITAHHCGIKVNKKATSGYCLNNGCRNDITITESLDKDRGLDFHIFKIRWKNGKMPEGQKFPPSILTDDNDLKTGKKIGEGDEIFTVGFPADKTSWGATFAKGRLKTKDSSYISYNIGIINGNSGGAVWRIEDKMLVGLTNHGPHAMGMPGWDKNKLDDPKAWNGGTNMAVAYKKSKVLQEIFPNGKNRYSSND